MADERGFAELTSDVKGYARDNLYENGLPLDEADFSDPDEFVDKVSDDGLWCMLTLQYNFPRAWLRSH